MRRPLPLTARPFWGIVSASEVLREGGRNRAEAAVCLRPGRYADAQRQGVEVGPEGEVGHRTLCQVEHHGLGSTALRGLLLLVYPRYDIYRLSRLLNALT